MIALIGAVLTGCAPLDEGPPIGAMLPGTIFASDGTVMQFAIQKTHGSGSVSAFDPSTQERFSGTYVAVTQGANVGTTAYATNGTDTAVGFGSGVVRSNLGDATAYLRGDKGTMLTCSMQIQPGYYPHGLGTCSSNHGGTYRLQF